MKKRILVVEDDAALARVLCDNLGFEGFQVQCVSDGGLAINAAKAFAPDLVLLDITLPGKNGLELCRIWREGPRLPVILLTARAQKADKLRGLKTDADDYVTKPFDLEELMARVHAVLRRARPTIDRQALGTVTIDFVSLEAWNPQGKLELSYRDSILRYLAERADSVVHRDELLHEIWGYPESPNTRAVDHAVARLRRTIEADAHHPRFIHTVHGDGYLLTMEQAPSPPSKYCVSQLR
ncbi:MAG: response regulator transcription factor [Acidobacteriota bacterium]